MEEPLRCAVFGAGFWTRVQLEGWRELGGVELVAIYNRTRPKAEALAQWFGIPRVYDDPARLLDEVRPDFVDNITEIGGHVPLSRLCAERHIACICQKPLAPTLAEATDLVEAFRLTGTPLFVHENWRWQSTMRRLRELLRLETIGRPLRAHLTMVSGVDVFAQQPTLRFLERFILMDMGSHLFDVCRVLFGEARSICCFAARTLMPHVRGENLATVVLTMGTAGTHVVVEMGYAGTPLEPARREVFPQTLVFVEGSAGSIEVDADYVIRVTARGRTEVTRHPPSRYRWVDPQYEAAQTSIVACCDDLLGGLTGQPGRGETTGADNLKTMTLVFAAYESAVQGRTIHF